MEETQQKLYEKQLHRYEDCLNSLLRTYTNEPRNLIEREWARLQEALKGGFRFQPGHELQAAAKFIALLPTALSAIDN